MVVLKNEQVEECLTMRKRGVPSLPRSVISIVQLMQRVYFLPQSSFCDKHSRESFLKDIMERTSSTSIIQGISCVLAEIIRINLV